MLAQNGYADLCRPVRDTEVPELRIRVRTWAAELYNEQFEGGRVQWCCEGGDVMTDGSVRERKPLPA